MMSIPDTLTLHRVTRERYVKAARACLYDIHRFYHSDGIHHERFWRLVTAHGILYAKPLRLNHFHIFRCFLRHARAANRKLVQVKRLQRMLSSPNNWDGWI